MSQADVAIVKTGGANIASLLVALERLNVTATLTTDPTALNNASHVILPGVGAAEDAMQRLEALQLEEVIRSLTVPVLGICLGMQLLAAASEEDSAYCLGITEDVAHRMPAATDRPVPHIGWNDITPTVEHPLLDGIPAGSYFYFVHSYALPEATTTIATAEYGAPFAAVMAANNFYGTQFHPERSADVGQRLLANFLALPA
ncbi:MAG: imidazole glycerol phosphate synthase subunit HisH [Pseudomonadota bacterium]